MFQMSHKTMIKYSPYDNIENIDINLCGGDNIQVREGLKKKTDYLVTLIKLALPPTHHPQG